MQYLLDIKYRRIIISMIAFMFLFKIIEANSQSRLQHLEGLDGKKLKDAMIQYYDSVRKLPNYQERIEAADAAFEFTSTKGDLAHLQSILFRASIYKSPHPSIFNKAYQLAKKINDVDEICNVEYSRSKYYLARKQYDSAVYYILRYKDLTKADIEGDGYQNIIEFLGDIYYRAGLYSQAKELYSQIYQVYEDSDFWNYYRPYVMMNNLGQIDLRMDKLNEAANWFEKSLNLAESKLDQPYRNNIIAFIRIKIAETDILQGNYTEAQKQLNIAKSFPADQIQKDVKDELLFYQAQLYVKNNASEKATELAQKLLPNDTLSEKSFRFIPEIYQLMAEIYADQGNDSLSVMYYQKFHHTEDSLKQKEHLARSMIILAERDIHMANMALKQSNKRIQMLSIGAFLLLFIIVIISILYRRLYHSKLELVRKSLPDKPINVDYDTVNSSSQITKDSAEENLKQKDLIQELKVLMETQKPFLEHGIGIKQIAELLSTNRTYLSRAINQQLDTNFPNLLNDYRIKEAIRLITSGYAKEHTQEALAKKSGFSSRNVFTTAFKKHTGVLPSFFIANYKKWDQQDIQKMNGH